MKPHRSKHLREKAVRRNSAPIESRLHKISLSTMNEQVMPFKDHLKPIDTAKAQFVLNYYIKHWIREKIIHLKHFHRSRGATPGQVEGEGPYTVMQEVPNKLEHRLK